MNLNQKIPYIQVKRPIKTNKYCLNTGTEKISAKELYKSKGQVNIKRKDIKLLVICSEIPPHPDPASCGNSQLNCDKVQITGFRKTLDNRAGNLRTDTVMKSIGVNLNDIRMTTKTHAKHSWKSPDRVS